jgi:hypothetical protein
MTDPTPFHRLVVGHDTVPAHRVNRLAATHQPDPTIEEWIRWRTADPDRYAQLPTTARLAVGHYEQSKAAADTTPDTPA